MLLKTVATRYAVQSKFKTERFLEAGYAVRGEKLIQVSKLSLELATRYAVDNKFKMARYLRRWLRGTRWL